MANKLFTMEEARGLYAARAKAKELEAEIKTASTALAARAEQAEVMEKKEGAKQATYSETFEDGNVLYTVQVAHSDENPCAGINLEALKQGNPALYNELLELYPSSRAAFTAIKVTVKAKV